MTKCFMGHEYESPGIVGFDQKIFAAPNCPKCYEKWMLDEFFNPGRQYLTSASGILGNKNLILY
jgi:hypothetical protein